MRLPAIIALTLAALAMAAPAPAPAPNAEAEAEAAPTRITRERWATYSPTLCRSMDIGAACCRECLVHNIA